jgi:NTE family protein
MRSPDGATVTRQDAYFGVVADTPLGVISIAPAIGTNGERKLVLTIGKLF